MHETLRVGIDIGSTTVKIIILNHKQEIAYQNYLRHFSEIKKTVKLMLKKAAKGNKLTTPVSATSPIMCTMPTGPATSGSI